jgi:DNA-binding XRE family transcriptional regulator
MATALLEHPAIIGFVAHTIDAEQVKRRRMALGWSRDDLGERAGVTGRTVYNAEHGKVGESAALRIMGALDAGESERRHADEPSLSTITVEIDGMKVVVTGVREKLDQLDLNALIRPRGES